MKPTRRWFRTASASLVTGVHTDVVKAIGRIKLRLGVKLILQPDDGVTPLIKAIESATKSIEIVIFRFDRPDIQRALERAVARGV